MVPRNALRWPTTSIDPNGGNPHPSSDSDQETQP